MHTLEEVRTETYALLKETEEQVAQLRNQRTILECLMRELLKLHAQLKLHGIGSDKLPRLLASHGLLPHPFPLLQAKKQEIIVKGLRSDQETGALAPLLAQVQ